MAKWDKIEIEHHMTVEELDRQIKSLERMLKFNRLHFIRNRYLGDSVDVAASKSGVSKRVGYIWQERWNEEGYDGLIPKYGGGRPSQLSDEDKKN